jgi:hypothetical protein
MMALSKGGGPAFGANAFIWAAEWTPEGAERVISGAAGAGLDFVEIPLLGHQGRASLPAREGKIARCARMKENPSSPGRT